MNRGLPVVASLLVALSVWALAHYASPRVHELVVKNSSLLVRAKSPEPTSGIQDSSSSGPEQESLSVKPATGVGAEPNPESSEELIRRGVEAIPDDQLRDVVPRMFGQVGPGEPELRQALLRRWTELAPQEVADWMDQMPEGPALTEAIAQVAVTRANKDLSAAIAWTQSLAKDDSRQQATLNIAYEAARLDPLTSMELAITLPASPERDRLLAHAASQWTEKDPASATGWAGSIPDPVLKQAVLSATLVALAGQAPADAANLAATALVPGPDQDRTVVAIVERWAQSSPRAAADWVTQFPDTPMRQIAVQDLVSLWTAQDPADTLQWLQTLPEDSLRQAGWTAYRSVVRQ